MFPLRPFRTRGWLVLACGVAAFWLAWLLGRRDLLTVAMFCFALLAAAYGALHFFKIISVGHTDLKIQSSFSKQ